MKLKNLGSNIYLAETNDRKELAYTFLRPQEFYESPRFKDQIFTIEEFTQWYEKEYESSYHIDWSGFNLPDHVFKPFMDGKFELSELEKPLIESARKIEGPFYIVGAMTNDRPTVLHEVSHGLFYLNPVYKQNVLRILMTADLDPIKNFLIEIGYDESVLLDECHAYLLFDQDILHGEQGIDLTLFQGVAKRLMENFNKFFDVKKFDSDYSRVELTA